MPRKAILKPAVRDYLIEVYLDLVQQKSLLAHKKVSGVEVRNRALRDQRNRVRPDDFRIPGIRSVNRALEGVIVPEMTAWSIGSMAIVSNEALPFLIDLQEWCQSIGRTLTSIEATWADRLFRVIDNSKNYSIDMKYQIVATYAMRQCVALAKSINDQVDTTDLDAWFFTRPKYFTENPNLHWNWIYDTSVFSLAVPPKHDDSKDKRSITRMNDSMGWITWGNPAIKTVLDLGLILPPAEPDVDIRDTDRPADLLDRIAKELTQTRSKVFAYWMHYMNRDGMRWQKMTLYQKIHLGNYLIDWVNELGKVLEDEDKNVSRYRGFNGQIRDLSDLDKHAVDCHPLEILNMAGIPKFMPETYFEDLRLDYETAMNNVAGSLLEYEDEDEDEYEDEDEDEDEDEGFWIYEQRDTNLT